jgi:hypothetical protein
LPNTEPEVPSDEFLEITKRLYSDIINQPSANEKYLMARVDSLCSLLDKDATPFTISVPEPNDTTVEGDVGSPGGNYIWRRPTSYLNRGFLRRFAGEPPPIASSEFLLDMVGDSKKGC